MAEPDATMSRIGQGIELSQRGERGAARQLFAEVWGDIGGESGDPLHVCALAHSMADVASEVHEELLWDLRALAAADLITDERTARAGVTKPGHRFLSVAASQPRRVLPQAWRPRPSPRTP